MTLNHKSPLSPIANREFLVALLLVFLASAHCFAGATYTAVSRTQTEAEKNEMKVRGWASGDSSKVEFMHSTDPTLRPGSYMLSTDGGKTIYLVDPSSKSFIRWDIMATLGAGQGMGKIEYLEPRVEKLLEEPGPRILGFPTRHYRFRTTYTVNVELMGRRMSSTSTTEEDIWASTKAMEPAMRILAGQVRPQSGNEQIDRMVKAEMDKVRGLPLKTVSVTRTVGQGRSETLRSEMEITSLRTVSVPASTFSLPAGYKQIEMRTTPDMHDIRDDNENP
jgi:hypothetical protein